MTATAYGAPRSASCARTMRAARPIERACERVFCLTSSSSCVLPRRAGPYSAAIHPAASGFHEWMNTSTPMKRILGREMIHRTPGERACASWVRGCVFV